MPVNFSTSTINDLQVMCYEDYKYFSKIMQKVTYLPLFLTRVKNIKYQLFKNKSSSLVLIMENMCTTNYSHFNHVYYKCKYNKNQVEL